MLNYLSRSPDYIFYNLKEENIMVFHRLLNNNIYSLVDRAEYLTSLVSLMPNFDYHTEHILNLRLNNIVTIALYSSLVLRAI